VILVRQRWLWTLLCFAASCSFLGDRSTVHFAVEGPSLSSTSPTSGALAGGTTLTLTGLNLLSGGTATLGGESCTNLSLLSSTAATCTLPAHAAGSVSLIWTNPDGQSATLENAYTYQPAPTITSLSPTSGSLAGGTFLALTGTGFITGATATVDGTPCSATDVISSTQVICTTPSHVAATVDIVITNSDSQVGSLTSSFTYIAAPTVTGVVANSGPIAGGTSVTITGTGFLAGALVSFGANAATNITVVNATTVTCDTPAGNSASAVSVTVANTDGQSDSLNSGFTYTTTGPTITSVSPTLGTTAGNTAITITGTNFNIAASVTLDGVACNNIVVTPATSIACDTPAHAAGGVDIVVTNPDAQTATLSNGFAFGTSDTWLATQTTGAPSARKSHVGVWTGDSMIVWGGETNLDDGGIYNPATNSWTAIASGMANAPSGRQKAAYAWTGSKLIVWGGVNAIGVLGTGSLYDPATNTWSAMTNTNAPSPRVNSAFAWTGAKFVIWGGTGSGSYYANGAAYDPGTDSWQSLSASPLSVRDQMGFALTDTELIIQGGYKNTGTAVTYSDGAAYNFTSDTWRTLNTSGAPVARYDFPAIWSGTYFILFGGNKLTINASDGKRYVPGADTWSAMTTCPTADSARKNHTAVWTGSRMILWGGEPNDSHDLNYDTGGVYNPTADTCSATSMVNAPDYRGEHTAVWANSQMIVWGGETEDTGGNSMNTGGRYFP